MNQEIPYGYCHCGCGQKTNLARHNDKRDGCVKGEPVRFIFTHYQKWARGEKSPNWRGGTQKIGGYMVVTATNKCVHRNIAEKALGKPLPIASIVHHHDGNGLNNANKNLIICENIAYHSLLHSRQRAKKETGSAHYRKCTICRQWDDPKKMIKRKNRNQWHHTACDTEYHRNIKNNIPKLSCKYCGTVMRCGRLPKTLGVCSDCHKSTEGDVT